MEIKIAGFQSRHGASMPSITRPAVGTRARGPADDLCSDSLWRPHVARVFLTVHEQAISPICIKVKEVDGLLGSTDLTRLSVRIDGALDAVICGRAWSRNNDKGGPCVRTMPTK